MGNILRAILLVSSFCCLLCKWKVPIKITIFYQPLCCKGTSRLKDIRDYECRCHFLSLLESFQKVMDRYRMAVIIQHCRIIDAFLRQSAKTLQDNIPCEANLRMRIFSSCKSLPVNTIAHENMLNLILPGVYDSVVSKWNN